ncbi:helix-turn-helix domain-containing protein [Candidatus Frankia alpina]|uniref:Helix-turn-helix transcriptional regulator n=1 Tax=Candidatus Frankia alpina TaxID=2699483 RepID=A0A4S5B6H9_9ACTN|nr:helix-turn-helix transcriptional regulator [Candidatus Frankia alpina]THJ25299.1 helix-turn-helix transcriptional regulator [Candidatus Frankia alpina]
MDRVQLGQALRARRREAGRTIASVGVDAGLSVPYIANLENARGNPTLSALEQLAAALGARLEVLMSSDDEDPGEQAASDAVRALVAWPRAL